MCLFRGQLAVAKFPKASGPFGRAAAEQELLKDRDFFDCFARVPWTKILTVSWATVFTCFAGVPCSLNSFLKGSWINAFTMIFDLLCRGCLETCWFMLFFFLQG